VPGFETGRVVVVAAVVVGVGSARPTAVVVVTVVVVAVVVVVAGVVVVVTTGVVVVTVVGVADVVVVGADDSVRPFVVTVVVIIGVCTLVVTGKGGISVLYAGKSAPSKPSAFNRRTESSAESCVQDVSKTDIIINKNVKFLKIFFTFTLRNVYICLIVSFLNEKVKNLV